MIYQIQKDIQKAIKKADKSLIPDSLLNDGSVISFNEQASLVTHHLANAGIGVEHNYSRKAEDVLTLWAACLNMPVGTLKENLLKDMKNKPFQPSANHKFTFIDLFAGIGGFRIAFQNLGGECVFSSEWDEKAQQTYYENYGDIPFGDITKKEIKNAIPDNFDVLCAGFPCQAFSLAGKKRGFAETRGTLFFDVAEILKTKQPKVVFLENVKGLAIHDKGKTLEVILNTLDEVGYTVPSPQIVNAMYFGVPQHRERIYIVGFRKDLNIPADAFKYPAQSEVKTHFIDIREDKPVPAKYYLSNTYWETLLRHKARHESKGNGFGYAIIPDNGVSSAIVVGGMGRERNLVIDKRQHDLTPTTNIKGEYNTLGIRRMTPREWARLQGYPDNFRIVVADASAYKQFGNSVAVPAIQATAGNLLQTLGEYGYLDI